MNYNPGQMRRGRGARGNKSINLIRKRRWDDDPPINKRPRFVPHSKDPNSNFPFAQNSNDAPNQALFGPNLATNDKPNLQINPYPPNDQGNLRTIPYDSRKPFEDRFKPNHQGNLRTGPNDSTKPFGDRFNPNNPRNLRTSPYDSTQPFEIRFSPPNHQDNRKIPYDLAKPCEDKFSPYNNQSNLRTVPYDSTKRLDDQFSPHNNQGNLRTIPYDSTKPFEDRFLPNNRGNLQTTTYAPTKSCGKWFSPNNQGNRRTSPYDQQHSLGNRISPNNQGNPQTSPYDPSQPLSHQFSANDRLKYLRKGMGQEPNHTKVPSNHSSCTDTSSDRSISRPSFMAKPSSMQERLKKLKNSHKNANPSNNIPSSSMLQNYVSLTDDSMTSADTQFSDDETMDWCAFEEKGVLDNITKLRKKQVISEVTPSTVFQQNISNKLEKMEVNKDIHCEIFIVVDTNVFLSNLSLINELLVLEINVSGVSTPSIMIPWMVIQELDYLKDSSYDSQLKENAKSAIRFINEKLMSKHSQVKGQSVADASQQNFKSKNADDAILFCCLQIKDRENNAILLSNDINLRNKALINGVCAYSHKTIIDGLNPYRDTGDGIELQLGFDYSQVKAVEVHFSTFFSFIILTKTHDAYGSSRDIMYPELKTGPFPLRKCLAFFKKFWRSIFCIFLQREFMYTVNQFIEFTNKHEDIETMGPSNIKTFIDTGLKIVSYVQDSSPILKENAASCKNKIEEVTKNIFVST